MCVSHIYTKSKFLGLSIGVHNIGQGSIYLMDRGEEYIVTFPSAYGRSILTVPWIELGGNVTISCAQTGYHASIDFLTKVIESILFEFNSIKFCLICSLFMVANEIVFLARYLIQIRSLF